MTKGISASGKDTWARKQMTDSPGCYKRVNKDLLREMLDIGSYSRESEEFIRSIRDIIVEKCLREGFDVIVSDTNLSSGHYEAMCEIARKVGDVSVQEIYFDVSLEEALRRNQERPGDLPDEAITGQYKRYIEGKKRITARRDYYN